MNSIKYFFLFIIILVSGCTEKFNDVAGFKYIDIQDAFGLVIGKYKAGSDTSIRIFKLTNADKLIEVKYLNESKETVNTNRIPIAVYNLNNDYYLITYTYGDPSQLKFESYLVQKFDGSVQQLLQPVLPEKYIGNVMLTDLEIDAIRSDNNSNYYYSSKNMNTKMNLKVQKEPTFETVFSGETLGNDYIIDYLGNILTSNKLMNEKGITYSLQNKDMSYTFPIKSYVGDLFYITKKADSLIFIDVNIENSTPVEMKMKPSFFDNGNENTFIISHVFPNINKSVILLSQGLFDLHSGEVKRIDLSTLNLSVIYQSRNSDNNYYVYGDNAIGNKVFIKVDPSGTTHVYTQIFTPNDILIDHFSVSKDDKIIFSGKKVSNGKKIYGYIPASGNNWIIEDDQGITDIQILIH
jgi:hypothetical protein